MMTPVATALAQYKAIAAWKPQLGDIVFQHGLFTHWFGIVSGIDKADGYGKLTITKAGLPILLVSMHDAEAEKNKIEIPIADVLTSKSGKFAALQQTGNTLIWYV